MNNASNVKTLPTIHQSRQPVKSYQANKDDVQDIEFDNVAAIVKKKVTVVYNHFNLEAIVSAAILKNCYPEFTILTAAQVFDQDSELYVWLGVSGQDLITRKMKENNSEHREYNTHDAQPIDENGHRDNIVDRICNDFNIRLTTPISLLSYQISQFFKPNTELADLVNVYRELLIAVDILNDVEDPRPRQITEKDYIKAINQVKKRMVRSYRKVTTKEGYKTMTVLYTNFPDYQFILALRLIKLAHVNFMNHVVSLGNNLLYTNLYEPEMSEEMQNIVLLN